KEEIEKMKTEAEAHSAEDQKRKESIEINNIAENLIYTSEKTLKDAGDKVKDEDKKEVEEKISALKEALGKDDLEKIKTATAELSEKIQKVGAAMYEASKPAESAQAEDTKEEAKTEQTEETKEENK
ncbi:TPA: molecular chaperone DnaK, partial [Candidatus Berkelbacteria bacterium]|nr:molecular chaperone DnaK [Candidatus Berkelbacteria bacterium]